MFKTEETQISKIQKELTDKYLKIDGNLYDAKKIFSGMSFFKWIILNAKDKRQYEGYIKQLIKHLEGEIEMYWEKDTIKIKKETA